jgi:hypothetical protein
MGLTPFGLQFNMDKREYYKIAMNRWYSETSKKPFTRFIIEDIADSHSNELLPFLKEWEISGYRKILKFPHDASVDEDCVQMLKRIE